VNSSTLLGAGGELSDFSYIAKLLDELVTEDFVADDGIKLSAPEVHAYLTRVMYNRRNKCEPLVPSHGRRSQPKRPQHVAYVQMCKGYIA